MGRFLPEENTLSDLMLLLGSLIRENVEAGRYILTQGEIIRLSEEEFRALIGECKERFGGGWIKTYREMTTEELYRQVSDALISLELVEKQRGDVLIRPALGRVIGKYPDDFKEKQAGDVS